MTPQTSTPNTPLGVDPPPHFAVVVAEVERAIEQGLDEPSFPETLRSAVRYAALGAGKRLRPALTLLACEACGGDRATALTPAVAVELIHAFSLVHDDLPALDNDELRRGRPTLHVQYDEATAILAGDAMMSMAFGLLAAGEDATPGTSAALVRELARATNRMIAGQVLDTVGDAADGAALDPASAVRVIHAQKTGALICAACRMGAIVAGADASRLDAITRYGDAVGLMFQIVDDLIDVEQLESHTGKKTGKDEAADKLTYPGVLGVGAARAEAHRLREEAIRALSPLGDDAQTLIDLTAYLASRTR
ncbi:MAG: polyprenyl synthetase family protein [Phycisphaeraceae bacterium]|nr:polyprenyl synthetase family protein [Phycisphaeraceae bacterium]MCB9847500.1 polyprenyl synthetase family protein [Phycisphaeraceae bacterium]